MNNKIKKKYKKSFFLGTIKKEIKCFQHRKIYIYIYLCVSNLKRKVLKRNHRKTTQWHKLYEQFIKDFFVSLNFVSFFFVASVQGFGLLT